MDVTLETPMCSLETHLFSLETPTFSLETPLFFWRPHIFMELILFSLETPRFPLGGLQRKNGISNSTPTMMISSKSPYLITFFLFVHKFSVCFYKIPFVNGIHSPADPAPGRGESINFRIF